MKTICLAFVLILFSLNTRADVADWFVVLDATNGFYASPGVPEPAITALKTVQNKNDEIKSFVFTPTGDWLLLHDKGFEASSEGLPDYQHLKGAKCVAYAPAGSCLILYPKNGFWGPGSDAWVKVKQLLNSGHEVRSVSFAPDDGYVVLYDEAGISHGDVPTDLAKILDSAATNNIPIQCVAFSGRDWICLAQDDWWASDTNLPAAKIIDQDFKRGLHPKWISFVPYIPPFNSAGAHHVETHFKRRVIATLTTTYASPETVDGILTVYAPVPPTLPMQHLISCDIRCRDNPEIVPTTVTDVKNPLQHYLRLDIPITPKTLQHPCAVDMTYVIDLYSAKLVAGSPQENNVSSVVPDVFSVFLSESSKDDFTSPPFPDFLTENGLRRQPDESTLHFAYRAYQFLHDKMHYVGHYSGKKATTLCQTLTGDCGAYTIISASTLAANGVPVASFPGRWASDEQPTYGQFHCFNGFFEPGIGWITFDAVNKFGSVDGNFIAFSLTSDDCPQRGMTSSLCQFQMNSYHGHSPYHPKCEDHWHVKAVSQSEQAKTN